ncbi:MAG TPA: ABC transporter permease [Pseudobacteroides sp.]|uniref:ABC transporter permease n=1 Tax=Pseudobacteroides sp. TaxID=1968840 RepID=UPI002F937188
MEELRAASVNEIERLFKKRKAIVAIIISIIAIILGQLVVVGIRFGIGSRAADKAEFPLLVLFIFVNAILPLFTALVSIDIFAGEFSQNTMKIAILRPISRLKLFLSKIVAIAFFVFMNLLVVMSLSTLIGMLFNPGNISFMHMLKIVSAYLISIFPVLTVALMVVFLANLFKNGTAAFFASTIVFLGFKVLEFLFGSYKIMFITSMLDWYSRWTGDISVQIVTREFLIMLACSLMAFSGGFYLFDKKEL